jgi:RNA polymerase sigma-70 factor, ECF subfamily
VASWRPSRPPLGNASLAKDAAERRSFPLLGVSSGFAHVKPSGRYSRKIPSEYAATVVALDFEQIKPMRALDPQSLTRHIDRLYRAAWALCGSREDAEDLVQETFARVLSKPRSLHGDDELAYLMRVLRNTFFSSRRTASRRPVRGASLDDVVVADTKPTSQPEHALDVQELYGAVAQLSDDFRLALVAVDILGLSYKEAASALRTREATITTRLFRARRQVARLLSDDPQPAGGESRASSAGAPPEQDRSAASAQEPVRKFSPSREGSTAHERLAEQGNL